MSIDSKALVGSFFTALRANVVVVVKLVSRRVTSGEDTDEDRDARKYGWGRRDHTHIADFAILAGKQSRDVIILKWNRTSSSLCEEGILTWFITVLLCIWVGKTEVRIFLLPQITSLSAYNVNYTYLFSYLGFPGGGGGGGWPVNVLSVSCGNTSPLSLCFAICAAERPFCVFLCLCVCVFVCLFVCLFI